MNSEKQLFDDVPLRRFEYDDTVVLAADVGTVEDASVDVVDDTVIIVVGDEQYEQELPDSKNVRAFMNHGILTIELSDNEGEDR